jgi:hypothetical protein
MANEIDLYQDLETLDEMIKKAKKTRDKMLKTFIYWRRLRVKDIKQNYPDLKLN